MIVSLIRTIILYFIVVTGIRIMGKRQLGELQPSELVVTILISNIASLPIENRDTPLLGGVIPILALVCCEVFVSTIALKSLRARRLVSGNAKIVIFNGVIDQHQLKELRFTIDDLMGELRRNSIFNVEDVACATVETNGNLSVFPKFEAQNVTAKMLNVPMDPVDASPHLLVISDGKVIEEALQKCNLNIKWLDGVLSGQKLSRKDVFMMTCNNSAHYSIVKKEKKR